MLDIIGGALARMFLFSVGELFLLMIVATSR